MSGFNKITLPYPNLYVASFKKDEDRPFLIFIHGGPGYNCGIVESLIEHNHLFNTLNYNIIVYDQRNCGRSLNTKSNVTHSDNVTDFNALYHYLISEGLSIQGFIGHSYGAKLLFDFYRKFNSQLPGIFISSARSILTPRLNNLLFDITYLKKIDPPKYEAILTKMDCMNLNKLWELTEELSPIFQQNKDRAYHYWANLDWMKKSQEAQKKNLLPVNEETFISVRKDLYLIENNFSVDIDKLKIPYLWINGFHDTMLNSAENFLSEHITLFYKSAHYPHIEENSRFNETVNHFLADIRNSHEK